MSLREYSEWEYAINNLILPAQQVPLILGGIMRDLRNFMRREGVPEYTLEDCVPCLFSEERLIAIKEDRKKVSLKQRAFRAWQAFKSGNVVSHEEI